MRDRLWSSGAEITIVVAILAGLWLAAMTARCFDSADTDARLVTPPRSQPGAGG